MSTAQHAMWKHLAWLLRSINFLSVFLVSGALKVSTNLTSVMPLRYTAFDEIGILLCLHSDTS